MIRELFFLMDYADLGSVDLSLIDRCDRLAMTPAAMIAFEEKGLSYLTLNDFYENKEFRKDHPKFLKAVEDVFLDLDKKYEPYMRYPRAFTGNIYWFLVFFIDLYYVARICEKIDKSYERIYALKTKPAGKILSNIKLEFSPEGVVVGDVAAGFDNKTYLFRNFMPARSVWIREGKDEELPRPVRSKHGMLFTIKRILVKIRFFLSQLGADSKKVIFVIQDGYEVSLLKRYMPGYRFVNPVNKILKLAKDGGMPMSDIPPLFKDCIAPFVNNWFSNAEVQDYIFKVFHSYHDVVARRLKPFLENADKMAKRYKPIAFFYSSGADKVYEDVCAYIANQNDIPVFYFQHGGSTVFYLHPYQKYIEENRNVKKMNILQSRVEKRFYADNVSTTTEALGALKLHRLYNSRAKTVRHMTKIKILYCASLFGSHWCKDLMVYASDAERYAIDKDIINVSDKLSLAIDIKVPPTDESYLYRYFEKLAQGRSHIHVLRGFSAERIIGDYGLILMTDITSALIPVSLVLDIPIVVYLKDISFLRKETLPDFEKRFYLARDKNDLDRYMKLYAEGRLESKFSPEIVDKYAFPVADGNPGVNIARYIKNRTAPSWRS